MARICSVRSLKTKEQPYKHSLNSLSWNTGPVWITGIRSYHSSQLTSLKTWTTNSLPETLQLRNLRQGQQTQLQHWPSKIMVSNTRVPSKTWYIGCKKQLPETYWMKISICLKISQKMGIKRWRYSHRHNSNSKCRRLRNPWRKPTSWSQRKSSTSSRNARLELSLSLLLSLA